jgi:uncharacterized membrane protein YkgB
METFNVVRFNRIALFVVFFWFGFLKVIGVSPAEELVSLLFNKTLSSFMSIDTFLVTFGLFEMVLGLIWLVPKWTKYAFWVFGFHMFTTFLPFIFIPEVAMNENMTLTLVGQYIVKNIVLLGSGLFLYSNHSDECLANDEIELASI